MAQARRLRHPALHVRLGRLPRPPGLPLGPATSRPTTPCGAWPRSRCSSEAALDQAQQVAKARAAVADRLAQAESDVVLLTTARDRRAQELDTADRPARRRWPPASTASCASSGRPPSTACPPWPTTRTARPRPPWRPSSRPAALRWELLAAIGKTESNHGVGRLDVFGNSLVPIIGIPIGGDTDGGALDGDSGRDHAVGPDAVHPLDVAQVGHRRQRRRRRPTPGTSSTPPPAAGRYLCRAAGDLTLRTEAGVIRAILSYNPNQTYLRVVGARFEALASDLALGWFSAATLPPAPPPGGGRGRRTPARTDGRRPGTAPTLTAAARHDRVTEVRVFGPQDLTTSTTAPVTIAAGRVRRGRPWPSIRRRRVPPVRPDRGARSLDPCEVAPRTTPRSSAACRTRPARPSCSAWPARRRRPSSAPPRRTGCWSWTAAIAACPSRRPSRPSLRRRRRRRPPRRRPAGRAPRRRPRAPRTARRHSTTGATPAHSRVEHDHGDDHRRTRPRRRRPRGDLGDGRDGTTRRRPRPRRRPRRPAPPRPPRRPPPGTDHHVGADHDHPARRAADLRLRERGDRHRAARTARPRPGRRLVRQAGLADRQLVVVRAFSLTDPRR